jgi:hypothetical protein
LLVGLTLLLLLLLVVIGNTHSSAAWREAADLPTWRDARLTNGASYSKRLLRLLPWSLPLVAYCVCLATRWPQQEHRIVGRNALSAGLALLVVVHGLHALSWSSLLIAFAATSMALPRIDAAMVSITPMITPAGGTGPPPRVET